MEDQGVVNGKRVWQERRPNKRVFTITAAGRSELAEFTRTPPRPSAQRDELLVKLAAVDIGDQEAVAEAVSARVDQAHAKLEIYRRLQEAVLDGRTEKQFLANGDRIGPYLTLKRGMAFEEENIEWGQLVISTLARRNGGRAHSERAAGE